MMRIHVLERVYSKLVVLGLKRTLFLVIALVLPFFAFTQIVKADVGFTVTNMDFNPVTGDFSFDYDAGGVTLNHQVTLRTPLDASSFNYDVNVGLFSCTASHCSGNYTGDKSNFTCAGSDYRIMSTTDVNGNGEIQYTSSPLTAAEFSSTCTTAVNQLSALNPAGVWIGLKNSDDVGTKFDLKVEAYNGSTLVASGELDSFAGGSSGFNNAHLATIPFNAFSPVNLPTGSVISLTVSVRNACVGSGHNSGTARLWYDDSAAGSGFGAKVDGSDTNYYLRDAFALATAVGAGPKKTIDVQAGSKCSAFKPFGTWSKTL